MTLPDGDWLPDASPWRPRHVLSSHRPSSHRCNVPHPIVPSGKPVPVAEPLSHRKSDQKSAERIKGLRRISFQRQQEDGGPQLAACTESPRQYRRFPSSHRPIVPSPQCPGTPSSTRESLCQWLNVCPIANQCRSRRVHCAHRTSLQPQGRGWRCGTGCLECVLLCSWGILSSHRRLDPLPNRPPKASGTSG